MYKELPTCNVVYNIIKRNDEFSSLIKTTIYNFISVCHTQQDITQMREKERGKKRKKERK